MTLARLPEVLVECLLAEEPEEALRLARGGEDKTGALTGEDRQGTGTLSDSERDHLARLDPDGLRLTALLIQKLRFERILRGDPDLRRRFEEDPEGFTRGFQRYLRATPPRAVFPAEEAEQFRAFLAP